ncbi:unnamed protein product [Soboliphyme baturini]|uniref:Optic atrophy 3-like protein n=1 Tax=Soboliphyme baturini TaxID=241478 RepID=A0A183IBH9_9BILA|nr:unnamed protein product [Soboliphyme baturini]
MVVAFPIIKLGSLLVRQISRPLANQIKNGAKRSSIFRRFVCLPIAQCKESLFFELKNSIFMVGSEQKCHLLPTIFWLFYHKVEMTRKMVWLGFGKPVDVPALTEEAAVELGANLVGELIVYVVAVIIFTVEYNRTNEKARIKELEIKNQLVDLEYKVKFLDIQLRHQDAEIRSMERHLASKTRFVCERHSHENVTNNISVPTSPSPSTTCSSGED